MLLFHQFEKMVRPAVFFSSVRVSTLWSPRRTWYKFYVGAISNEIAHRTKPNVTVEKSVGCAQCSDVLTRPPRSERNSLIIWRENSTFWGKSPRLKINKHRQHELYDHKKNRRTKVGGGATAAVLDGPRADSTPVGLIPTAGRAAAVVSAVRSRTWARGPRRCRP